MKLLFLFILLAGCALLPGCWKETTTTPEGGSTENLPEVQSESTNSSPLGNDSKSTSNELHTSIDLAMHLNGMSGAEALQALVKEGNVVIDFFAVWCPPCQQMHPIIDTLASEYTSRIKFVKIDVDKFPDLAQGIKIGNDTIHANNGIPQFYFFKDGILQKAMAGGMRKDAFKAEIDRIFQ